MNYVDNQGILAVRHKRYGLSLVEHEQIWRLRHFEIEFLVKVEDNVQFFVYEIVDVDALLVNHHNLCLSFIFSQEMELLRDIFDLFGDYVFVL